MKALIVASLLMISSVSFAQHVAVLCTYDVYKETMIEGTPYNIPNQEAKVYEGTLIHDNGKTVTIETNNKVSHITGCVVIEVN